MARKKSKDAGNEKKEISIDKETEEEKSDENSEDSKTEKKNERRIEKELLWVFGFLFFLVILFLFASSIFKLQNRVEHEGITFNKERLGEIPVYHYSYYFENKGDLIKYNLYVRNDPRTLNVPVYGDQLIFKGKSERVYVSLDPRGLQECPNSVIAIADLASFLTDNQLDVKSGNPDFFEAASRREEWITCENKPGNTVIEIGTGDESRIDIDENCIRLVVGNCEILEAVEKFKIQSVIDAKEFDESNLEAELL